MKPGGDMADKGRFPSEGVEEIDHTADAALRVWGPDLASLLRQAALGMGRLMRAVPLDLPRVTRHLVIEASDRESLLVEWLSALALSAETEGVRYDAFEFGQVTDVRLEAVAHGVRVSAMGGIKAVTYHDLRVTIGPRGMETTVTFDM